MEHIEVSEGRTSIFVPVQDSSDPFPPGTATVFYNRRMLLNRDLTIALLAVIRPERYLDAMGATGIRGIRASWELGIPVCINDRSAGSVALIRKNAERYGAGIEVTQSDVNVLLHSRRFDAVDLDPFGTPAPFLDAAVRSARRYLFVTATDTAPLCGSHLAAGIRRYGAFPRNTEYHAEVGLRVLLGFAAREAVRYDRGLRPLLSVSHQHFVRLFLALEDGVPAANRALASVGYVYQCSSCLFRAEEAAILPRPGCCPLCGAATVPVGPLWLGPVCDPALCRQAVDGLPGLALPSERALATLLPLLAGELPTATHYDYHRVARALRVSPPQRDALVGRLQAGGYSVSRAHYSGTALKTDAPLPVLSAMVAER